MFDQDDWPGLTARQEASKGWLSQRPSVAARGELPACLLVGPGVEIAFGKGLDAYSVIDVCMQEG